MENNQNTSRIREREIQKIEKKIPKTLNTKQIVWPVLFGAIFVGVMLYYQLHGKNFSFDVLRFSWITIFGLFAAGLCMALRDIGYMIRIRVLADHQLTWRQAFRIIMLWEFTSAVMPSAGGGTTVAVIYVYKEGISIGKSTSIVLLTSFLDELYFVLMFPILLLAVGPLELFSVGSLGKGVSFTNEFFYFGVVGYAIILIYVIFVGYGLFKNPALIKKTILKIFQLRFLRRWRKSARRAGRDIELGSRDFKSKPFSFWVKAFGSTFLSWTARYWVVNFIFIAFFSMSKGHFLLFARQLVMWIMMHIFPTPGGSGLSELVFSQYLGDFIPASAGIAVVLAVLWRFYTYYPYLFIGATLVPGWVKRSFIEK
jgi:hypothetical protein